MQLPEPPDVPLQWLTERNWFFRLSAYQDRLSATSRSTPSSSSPSTGATRCSGSSAAGPRGLLDQPRADAGGWGIPFPIAENGETAQREDGSWDPEAGVDLRLVRRAHQLHHRRRLPGRPGGVREVVAGGPARHRQGHHPVPHDLLAGDAHERRPRAAAPRSGSTAGCSSRGERMSKSRGNFLDPTDVVAALRLGRRALRRAARGRRSTGTPRSRGTRSSAATTPTSRTTSATS